jgi:RimJ/RimL family protein N-acetyltransferase
MPMPDALETLRLLLRRWREDDRDALAAIWADREVWAWLQPGRPYDPAAMDRLDDHLEHWREHGFGLYAAVDRESGEVIGWIGPSHPTFIPELASEVEIGWTLRRPFWGRGLAGEGARAALDATFEHLRPPQAISLIHRTNARSSAVARKLGMELAAEVLHPSLGDHLQVYRLEREL